MALSQRLEFRQSQALVMTPQLMQAIKLLQLSNLDLVGLCRRRTGAQSAAGARRSRRAEAPTANQREAGRRRGAAERMADRASNGSAAIEDAFDTGIENVFPDSAEAPRAGRRSTSPPRYSEWASVGSGGREDGDYNLEAFVSAETTLADHLAEQLALAIADPARRMIGQHLIDLVDEAGYLTGDLAAVAEQLGAPLAEVEAVLAILQGFDPAGVCARNLTECLAIQLKERDRFDPAMQALLAHLDLLARRDFAALRRVCGVDDDDLADMIAEIRAAQSQARPRLRLGDGAADRARRVRAREPGRRLAGRTELRHAAERAGEPALLRDGVEDARRTTTRSPISPTACRPRPGWCERSISAPRRS